MRRCLESNKESPVRCGPGYELLGRPYWNINSATEYVIRERHIDSKISLVDSGSAASTERAGAVEDEKHPNGPSQFFLFQWRWHVQDVSKGWLDFRIHLIEARPACLPPGFS
jgi:hypothetical protein